MRLLIYPDYILIIASLWLLNASKDVAGHFARESIPASSQYGHFH